MEKWVKDRQDIYKNSYIIEQIFKQRNNSANIYSEAKFKSNLLFTNMQTKYTVKVYAKTNELGLMTAPKERTEQTLNGELV